MSIRNCSFHWFRMFVLVAAIASVFAVRLYSHEDLERPNLVLIIADDCTYLDMQVYGGQAHTPRLNRLAKEGMLFSRCFQAAPMCSPTRHNIYTGIYPVRSGAWPNHTRVYDGTRSIAHYLKERGYRVALSGKTHIGPRSSFPFEYSKDFRMDDPSKPGCYKRLRNLIRESKGKHPFCLIACSNEPHTPYTKGNPDQYVPSQLKLPPSWVDTPETRKQYSRYLAEISYFDQQCGALLDLLDESGTASNTLVMVLSEQGSAFPFAKWTCYELGLASGMIVRWPGKVGEGTSSDALVEYVDIAPTFLEVAGVKTPNSMDGRSFQKVLLGESSEHKRYTFGIHTTKGIINGSDRYGIRSCGTKRYRYIRNLHHQAEFSNAVTRKGGDKADFWTSWIEKARAGDKQAMTLIRKYLKRPAVELYDVRDDPHCLKNLAEQSKYQSIREDLSNRLDQWMESQGDSGDAIEASAHTRKNGFRGPNIPAMRR